MNNRLRSIQTLRGVAILLVLLLHLYAYESTANLGPSLLPQISVFGSSGVDLFFVISGFVMVYTTKKGGTGPSSVVRFLWRRGARIYPLYWFYTGLLLTLYFILPQAIGRVDYQEVSVLQSILLFPQSKDPILIVGWTLIHEVYFYFAFSLFLLFPRRYLPCLLSLWAVALVAVNFAADIANFSPAGKLIFNPLTIEFIAGCFVGLGVESSDLRTGKKVIWLGVAWLISGWTFHYVYFERAGLTLAQRVLVLGLPYALIVWGSVFVESDRIYSRPRILELIGDASYSIYLTHCLVLSCVARVFSKLAVGFDSLLDNFLFAFSAVTASVALGVLSYRLVELKMLSFLVLYSRKQAS